MKDVLNTIDGEQRPPVNGRWLDNIEPATAALLGRIASSDSDDVDLVTMGAVSYSVYGDLSSKRDPV